MIVRPYILAVDPGQTSGVAVLAREGPEVLYSAELDFKATGLVVEHYLTRAPGSIAVVTERFTITVETAKKSPAPWSMEVNGMLKWLAAKHDAGGVKMYNASDTKAMFPNPALRRVGCWHRGGAGHAKDAIRHGLMYMIETGWSDPRLLEESVS